ncbi:MAG: ATP-dependent helicase [Solirubrobacterales bacterium]|nr:ATP-dependent helicase [Solirubrobacterales bacterium]
MYEPTDQQKAIIDHDIRYHARVIAGPGTGKSATAVALIERVLEELPDTKIKFLTFTRAATQELARKMDGGEVHPSTIHAFAIGALLRNPGAAAFPLPLRIPDDWEQRKLIVPLLARYLRGRGLDRAGVRDVNSRFLREMVSGWESLNPEESDDVTPQERAAFRGLFEEHRGVFGYTLMGELPDLLRRAIEDHDDLDGVDSDLLIVDEYQDLNACELRVLKLLADRGSTVIAIGDDDQSIYSFRRADPEGIRRFPIEFDTQYDYPMTICHRCPEEIIDWSQRVIAGDPGRAPRPEPTPGDNAPQGEAVLLRFANGLQEAESVAALVKSLNEDREIPLSEILILTRTDHNGQFSRPIKEALDALAIGWYDPSRIGALLQEEASRKFLAFLRLLSDRRDSLAWMALISLERGVGGTFVDYVYDEAVSVGASFGETLERLAADDFAEGPSSSSTVTAMMGPVVEGLEAIGELTALEATEWPARIEEMFDAGHLPPVGNELVELMQAVAGELQGNELSLSQFVSQLWPVGQDLARATSEGVRFMTMGGSKGLTVSATIVVGVEQDLIPRENGDQREERRYLYVAMTRSTEVLAQTYAARRVGPQARAGRANSGRRSATALLRDTGVDATDGAEWIAEIS